MNLRLTEDERTSSSRFREVSELRIQFQCEYKLYLTQKRGEMTTKAGIDGTMLHGQILPIEFSESQDHQWISLVIIILIIVTGIIWIVW
jgi:hypothetical protein